MTTATDTKLCQFVETIPGELYTCPVCGFTAKTSAMPSRKCRPWQKKPGTVRQKAPAKAATPKADPTARELRLQQQVPPCIHRGAVIEAKRTCELCGARGELYDLYACAIHGQCSLGKRDAKLKACFGCEDASPAD